MTKYYVTPPVVEYGPAGGGRLFIRYRLNRGESLMRNNGVWSQTAFPTEDVMKAADHFYLGGREYEITQDIYQSLIDQGFGANVRAE